MLDNARIYCCLLAAWITAAMAVAQEPEDSAQLIVVAPELDAAPEPEYDAAPLPEDVPPLPQQPPPHPPQVISSGNYVTHPHHCPDYCFGHACSSCRRGPVRRVKACLQWSYWGYADLFCEKPLGACLYAHVNTQIGNAMIARTVLYRYDFHDGILSDASRLNQYGRKRLKEMVWMLQNDVCPIVIEHTPEKPGLAAARRSHVLASLDRLNFPVPEEWVVVGDPEAYGLSGEEAILIHQKMLSLPSLQQQQGTGATAMAASQDKPAADQ